MLDDPSQPADQPPNRSWISPLQALLLTVLTALATIVVVQAAMLHSAQRMLQRAAAAGAREATLPKATVESVELAVERAAAAHPLGRFASLPIIRVNDRAELLHPLGATASGDEVTVSLSVWYSDVITDALGPFGFSIANHKLRASCAMSKP
jgi:hypothetical protein